MTRPDVFGLAREVDGYEFDETLNEPPVCIVCGGEYRIMEPDYDATPCCDGCAHRTLESLATALLALEPVYLAACDYADTRNGPRWRETAIALEAAAHTARAALGRDGE